MLVQNYRQYPPKAAEEDLEPAVDRVACTIVDGPPSPPQPASFDPSFENSVGFTYSDCLVPEPGREWCLGDLEVTASEVTVLPTGVEMKSLRGRDVRRSP